MKRLVWTMVITLCVACIPGHLQILKKWNTYVKIQKFVLNNHVQDQIQDLSIWKEAKKKIQLTILISTKIIQIASASMFWHFES